MINALVSIQVNCRRALNKEWQDEPAAAHHEGFWSAHLPASIGLFSTVCNATTAWLPIKRKKPRQPLRPGMFSA